MKKLKKIFTIETLKVIFVFIVISMIITLGFELFLMTYFDYVSIPEGIAISNFWWHTTGAAAAYSVLLLILFYILSYFDK